MTIIHFYFLLSTEQQVEGQQEKGKWQQNVKRGRGRPRKPRTEPEAPK